MIKSAPAPFDMRGKDIRRGDSVFVCTHNGVEEYFKEYPSFSRIVPAGSLRRFLLKVEGLQNLSADSFRTVDGLWEYLMEKGTELDLMTLPVNTEGVDVLYLQSEIISFIEGYAPGATAEVEDVLEEVHDHLQRIMEEAFDCA